MAAFDVMEVPAEISAAAAQVADYFQRAGIKAWQLQGIAPCDVVDAVKVAQGYQAQRDWQHFELVKAALPGAIALAPHALGGTSRAGTSRAEIARCAVEIADATLEALKR